MSKNQIWISHLKKVHSEINFNRLPSIAIKKVIGECVSVELHTPIYPLYESILGQEVSNIASTRNFEFKIKFIFGYYFQFKYITNGKDLIQYVDVFVLNCAVHATDSSFGSIELTKPSFRARFVCASKHSFLHLMST